MHSVVPLMARLGPGGADAQVLMEYFWDTVDNAVPPETIIDALSVCGFEHAIHKRKMLRMFSEYVAVKPA